MEMARKLRIRFRYKIELKGEQIEEKDLEGFGKELANSIKLKNLTLKECKIDSKGFYHVTEALKLNRTLTTFIMWDNVIDDDGGVFLGEMLKLNTCLTNFSLSSNKIGFNGMKGIAEGLAFNSTLTSFDLGYNNSSPNCLSCFSESLKYNSTLESICICKQDLRYDDLIFLSNSLQGNSKLSQISADINSLEGFEMFISTLKTRSKKFTLNTNSPSEFSNKRKLATILHLIASMSG